VSILKLFLIFVVCTLTCLCFFMGSWWLSGGQIERGPEAFYYAGSSIMLGALAAFCIWILE